MTPFWAGFACGIAATYALSLLVVALLVRPRPRRHAPEDEQPPQLCPEYPTVRFTHVSGIGAYVRGRDD